ncbi:MAG: hypothetical protein IAF94_08595 [Pirellulaceae bacterium]|nr:hypothetical protein [Pirellulaceae bacterium]
MKVKKANEILGIPEGRPGVWLIDGDTAEALIHAKPGCTVHNFIGHDGMFIGADWEKLHAIGLVHTEGKRVGMVFPPQPTYRHQLVVLDDDKRWAFDIGEIDEARMTAKRCERCQWPLKADAKDGCTAGNCSQRPVPTDPGA